MRSLPWPLPLAVAAGLVSCASADLPAPPRQSLPATPPLYTLARTEVVRVPAPQLGRSYRIYVSLPASYAREPGRRYPVLFLTDAPYAFPLVRAISSRLGSIEDIVIIGLSYADGETGQFSRRRDYTPTPHGDVDARSDIPGRQVVYGQAEEYRRYLRDTIFPFVAENYRVDMGRRTYAGHSYGGLFGAHVLLTEPQMFDRYILMSPSLWYGRKVMLARERAYAMRNQSMPASVFLAIGDGETVPEPSVEPREGAAYDMCGDVEQFAGQLRANAYHGLSLTTMVIPGEDHMSVYPVAITRGLEWAFGRGKQAQTDAADR